MSLSDLAAIGSFTSGIAVIITLIFLLLQMRQTTQSVRASMQQARAGRWNDSNGLRTQPFLSEIIARAANSDLTLDSSQVQAFMAWTSNLFWNTEDSLLQRRAGTIDPASFDSDLASLRSYLAIPAFRVAWRMQRDWTAPLFREYVDNLLKETRAAEFGDLTQQWKSLLTEELSSLHHG